MEVDFIRLPNVFLPVEVNHFEAQAVAFSSHFVHDLVGQEIAMVKTPVVEVGVLELGHFVAEFFVGEVFLNRFQSLFHFLYSLEAGSTGFLEDSVEAGLVVGISRLAWFVFPFVLLDLPQFGQVVDFLRILNCFLFDSKVFDILQLGQLLLLVLVQIEQILVHLDCAVQLPGLNDLLGLRNVLH